jgi:hypothetical protein
MKQMWLLQKVAKENNKRNFFATIFRGVGKILENFLLLLSQAYSVSEFKHLE